MNRNDIYGTLDDQGLFRLLQQNDRIAFTELYNRYSSVLYMFILFYVKEEELTRDTLQCIFMTLWEHRHKISIKTSVKNYLYTSAKNRVLNIYRSRKLRLSYHVMMHKEPRQPIMTPEELYERDELNRLLQLAIDDLRHEKKRQIIDLRRQGLSNKEVADKLNIPENTVRTYYLQSVKALRDNMKNLFFILLIIL